jgi:uncharacterized coiled-coil protein SlyX
MKRTEAGLEPRLRLLEITSATKSNLLDSLGEDLRQLESDLKDFEAQLRAIEVTLVRLSVPMKAVTWAATLFAASLIALVWSLILGKAQVIFP